MPEKYWYHDIEKEIGFSFDSIVFKDASGTCPPHIVHETVKKARERVEKDTVLWFHTHDTAGLGLSCIMAAIEAGADGVVVHLREDRRHIDRCRTTGVYFHRASPRSGGHAQEEGRLGRDCAGLRG